jgi:excisionase family DNA binding protein
VGKQPPKRSGRPPGKAPEKPLPNLAITSDDQLLTISQMRQFLAISDWFARRLIKERKLPAVYLGGNIVRVRVGDLRAFIAERRQLGYPSDADDTGEGAA